MENWVLDKSLSGTVFVSVIIPVRNGGNNFRRCLASLSKFAPASVEIVIVVDGGTDQSWQLANASGAKVFQRSESGGPALARNLGAKAAIGDILFFMDADVEINEDTLPQVIRLFRDHPTVDAMIGSYDDAPGAQNFLSQYKNLFHHYTHQTSSEQAATFWGACGAVRRDVFWTVGGFDEAYRYPSVEDIDLGYRLARSGYQIRLCKTIQVKHLKQWGVVSLLRAELFYRAIPWTELIWRDRQFANDLNLKASSRISLVLAYFLVALVIMSLFWMGAFAIAIVVAILLILLNLPVYQFFYRKRGVWFALRVIPWHWLYFLYGGLGFAIGTIRHYRHSLKSIQVGFS
jgi:GT2 family glycosyltransferase